MESELVPMVLCTDTVAAAASSSSPLSINISGSSANLSHPCLNYTDQQYDGGGPGIEYIVSIVVGICFGVIGVAGLIGNALVVLVVAANPTMRSTTNLLINNLAIADLLFVFCCIPFTATDYILPTWPFGNFGCKLVSLNRHYPFIPICKSSGF